MKTALIYISTLLIVCLMPATYAQPGCEVPLPPVLSSVSINPASSLTELKWAASPSTGIAAYIVYRYSDGAGIPLDTIRDPNSRSWTVNSPGIKYFSESYVVAAFRLPVCTSPLSNVISTIHCTSRLDSCNNQIIVEWNSYPDYPLKVNGYRVEATIAGVPGSTVYNVAKEANTLEIKSFITNTEYCFTVSALLDDGTVSMSNMSCIETKMLRPPGWISGESVEISEDDRISIAFNIDPGAETSRYILERRQEGSLQFTELATFNGKNTRIEHTDSNADVTLINQYRLLAVNNCGITVRTSNIISSLVVSAELLGNEISISWNPFCCWNGISGRQELWYDGGRGMELLRQPGETDSTITLNYSEIMYSISGRDICFMIKAFEAANPYGINGSIKSGSVCIGTKEVITVPDAFTPNGDLVNDKFRPVLSFTPIKYRLLITDLRRRKVFDSEDPLEEWDGTYLGSYLPSGAYLWFIELLTPSGEEIDRTGVLTIIK